MEFWKYIILILLFLINYLCGVAIGRRVERMRKINTAGTIYINLNAKQNEPCFKCAVTPEFIERAFMADAVKNQYVIFEVKEDLDEDNGMF